MKNFLTGLYLSVKCHYRRILMTKNLEINLLTNMLVITNWCQDEKINHQIIHR